MRSIRKMTVLVGNRMARREAIEVTCDRCGKVEIQTSGDLWTGKGTLFEGSFEGNAAVYEDLCKTCRKAVRNLYARIAKIDLDVDEDSVAKNETPGSSVD